jgi:hypothetical protein
MVKSGKEKGSVGGTNDGGGGGATADGGAKAKATARAKATVQANTQQIAAPDVYEEHCEISHSPTSMNRLGTGIFICILSYMRSTFIHIPYG